MAERGFEFSSEDEEPAREEEYAAVSTQAGGVTGRQVIWLLALLVLGIWIGVVVWTAQSLKSEDSSPVPDPGPPTPAPPSPPTPSIAAVQVVSTAPERVQGRRAPQNRMRLVLRSQPDSDFWEGVHAGTSSLQFRTTTETPRALRTLNNRSLPVRSVHREQNAVVVETPRAFVPVTLRTVTGVTVDVVAATPPTPSQPTLGGTSVTEQQPFFSVADSEKRPVPRYVEVVGNPGFAF